MPHFRRTLIVYFAINTETAKTALDYIGAKRAALDRLVQSCGLRVGRRFVEDVAEWRAKGRDLPPQLERAIQHAVQARCALLFDGDVTAALRGRIQARLLEHELEAYDVEALTDERGVIHARSQTVALKDRRRDEAAEAGRAEARTKGSRFGNPDTTNARKKALAAKAQAFELRRREYLKWRADAAAEGVTEARPLLAWLNARGIPSSTGGPWRISNLRRVLNELVDHDLKLIVEVYEAEKAQAHGRLHADAVAPSAAPLSAAPLLPIATLADSVKSDPDLDELERALAAVRAEEEAEFFRSEEGKRRKEYWERMLAGTDPSPDTSDEALAAAATKSHGD